MDNLNWAFITYIYNLEHGSELLNDLNKLKSSKSFTDYITNNGYLKIDIDYNLIKRELSY